MHNPAPVPAAYPPSLRRLTADMRAQMQAIGRVERAGLLTRGWTPHQLNLWSANAEHLLHRSAGAAG